MLGVDERALPAGLLRLGDDLRGEGGLPGGLRAEDLDDAAAGDAADAEGVVERDRAGRDGVDGDVRGVAHLHDGALPELLLDLLHREVEGLLLRLAGVLFFSRHGSVRMYR